MPAYFLSVLYADGGALSYLSRSHEPVQTRANGLFLCLGGVMLLGAFAAGCGGGGGTVGVGASGSGSSSSGGVTTSSSSGGGGMGGGSTSSSSSSTSTTSSSGMTTSSSSGGGAPPNYGPAATETVNAGGVVNSPSYQMVFTFGQPSANQGKMTSATYEMQGGLIGATGTKP